MIEGHDAAQTWYHSSGCFFSITAAMPDAMGAAGKQVGVERSRLIACIHTVEVERPDGSPKVDFAMLLLLRSEELRAGKNCLYGRTAHPWECTGQPYFKVLVSHMVGGGATNFALVFSALSQGD